VAGPAAAFFQQADRPDLNPLPADLTMSYTVKAAACRFGGHKAHEAARPSLGRP